MKKVRWLLVCVLTMTLCLTFSVGASDNDFEPDEVAAVLVCNGVSFPLSETELLALKSECNDNNAVSSLDISVVNQPGDINTYYEKSGSNGLVARKSLYVTPIVQGAASISYGQSYTITSTFTGSLGIVIKRAVVKDLGDSYSYSVATNEEFGVTFSIPEGKYARIKFTPMMRHTVGTYYYDSFTSYDVDAYIAIKVGKFSDGLYERVYVTPETVE